ncbi:iron ABC transporter permease [Propionibacteriaceae bacterium Y2011]|uniref:iron ABC transporter permease n=1 Tax=Microlunatus sp. Y2014 TaxID=3418488 RepID=UPI003B46B2AA
MAEPRTAESDPAGSGTPGAVSSGAPAAAPPAAAHDRLGPVLLSGGLLLLITVLAVVHLGQGTSDMDLSGVWAVITGTGTDVQRAVLLDGRLPRTLAAMLVGLAVGVSGAALQSVARNRLASPDTLAINAGAWLVLTIAAAAGLSLGVWGGTAAAFVGGLAAAGIALAISAGGSSPVRLVLAGSVLALALHSLTSMVIMMNSETTEGLFAWGSGSLGQNGMDAVVRAAPLIAVVVALALFFASRLDLLQLGDDAARSLGLHVTSSKVIMVVLAVLLAAAAVSVAGPLGFVGLVAPAGMYLCRTRMRGLRHHRWLLLGSGLTGAAVVLLADVVLRSVFTGSDAVEVPTGVITTLLGAIVLIILSQGLRTGRNDPSPALASASEFGRRHPVLITVCCTAVLLGALLAGILLGDVKLLSGDVINWLGQVASPRIEIVLDARWPRVLAAGAAGACLALAGLLVQAVTRNPLADPGLLGVSSGAGVGALASLVLIPALGWSGVVVGALVGASVITVIVFALASRGGLDEVRLVLVGLGAGAAAQALTTVLIVRTDPWNQAKALTWLGGSTYGAAPDRVLWATAALAVGLVIAIGLRSELDLLQLDRTTPQVVGVLGGRVRLIALVAAVLLTVAATTAIGVIAFVGLVAPHAARLFVGSRHRHLVVLAPLLGATLVVVADTVGRTVIAPAQVPAGMVTALIGTPYFIWLLWNLRGDR